MVVKFLSLYEEVIEVDECVVLVLKNEEKFNIV